MNCKQCIINLMGGIVVVYLSLLMILLLSVGSAPGHMVDHRGFISYKCMYRNHL